MVINLCNLKHNTWRLTSVWGIHHICHFFSTWHIFGYNFSPHKKRVNRDKTDFTVKQRKPLINWFGKKQGRFQFFTSVMWRNNKFLHNCQDFTILHICHVKKSEIPLHFSDFSLFAMYRNLKFLHMTDFSPHVSHVNFGTNMRYAST